MLLLVSNNAQVDGGVSMLLDGGQQGGAIRVSDLPWVQIVLWIQQLHIQTHTDESRWHLESVTNQKRKEQKCEKGVFASVYARTYLVSSGHDSHHRELVHADLSHSHCSQQADL